MIVVFFIAATVSVSQPKSYSQSKCAKSMILISVPLLRELYSQRMLRVSYSQQVVLNNNQLKPAAENAETMVVAEATVVVATDLTLVAARTTAGTTATATAMVTVTMALVTAATMTATVTVAVATATAAEKTANN